MGIISFQCHSICDLKRKCSCTYHACVFFIFVIKTTLLSIDFKKRKEWANEPFRLHGLSAPRESGAAGRSATKAQQQKQQQQQVSTQQKNTHSRFTASHNKTLSLSRFVFFVHKVLNPMWVDVYSTVGYPRPQPFNYPKKLGAIPRRTRTWTRELTSLGGLFLESGRGLIGAFLLLLPLPLRWFESWKMIDAGGRRDPSGGPREIQPGPCSSSAGCCVKCV